jgi:hypothetical protein
MGRSVDIIHMMLLVLLPYTRFEYRTRCTSYISVYIRVLKDLQIRYFLRYTVNGLEISDEYGALISVAFGWLVCRRL